MLWIVVLVLVVEVGVVGMLYELIRNAGEYPTMPGRFVALLLGAIWPATVLVLLLRMLWSANRRRRARAIVALIGSSPDAVDALRAYIGTDSK